MRGSVPARPPACRTFDHRQTLSLYQLFLGHLRNHRQFGKLSARDRRTGISTHQDDQDSNDSGHYDLFCLFAASLFARRLRRICFKPLSRSGFCGVQRLGKQSVSGHASNEDSCHRVGRQRSAGMNNFKLIKARDKFRVRIADKSEELVGRQRGGSAS